MTVVTKTAGSSVFQDIADSKSVGISSGAVSVEPHGALVLRAMVAQYEGWLVA